MKKDRKFVFSMNPAGELLRDDMFDRVNRKFRPDTAFLKTGVSYFLMMVCVLIDISFFKSLFEKISWDSPLMIWLEVAGLAFGADVVAVFAGILAKRIRQGLSKEKVILGLLIGVPVFALGVNGILRNATISLMSADGSVDAAAKALTIISIVTPIITSIGNFAISYLTYDPLGFKMKQEELDITELKDERRRLIAVKEAADSYNLEAMLAMDKEHHVNAKKELINDALILCSDVRVQLMEYLGDPTSTNVLSKSRFDDILGRLTSELLALDTASRNEAEKNEADRVETCKDDVENTHDEINFPEVA